MKPRKILSGFLAAACVLSTIPAFTLSASAQDNWQEDSAEIRQSIQIHNDTDSNFQDVPVLLRLDTSQISSKDSIRFYLQNSDQELPFEVESWNPTGISTVWVKVPAIAANGDTTIVGYYNGDQTETQKQNVWKDEFQLVEHFSQETFTTDSTGKATGTLTGTLTTAESDLGVAGIFTGDQKLVYDAVLSGENAFTISTVLDSDTPGSWVGIAARDKNGGVKDGDAYFLGIDGGSNSFLGRFYGTTNPKKTYEVRAPFSEDPHVVTLSYDGTKLKLYLDGTLQSTKDAADAGSVLTDYATPLVLGAYSDDELINTYKGAYDEVQITNTSTSDDWESFRYSNYFGNGITMNPIENRNGDIVFTVTSPQVDVNVETGNISFEGYVSEEAEISYSLNGGASVVYGKVNAGTYNFTLPVYDLGSQTIEITAKSVSDPTDTQTVTRTFNTVDTIAPKAPVLDDSSNNGTISSNETTLSATVNQADQETTSVQFFNRDTISITSENTVVRTGSTSASLPLGIAPDSGVVSQDTTPETVGENQTPYQIYEISLTDEQQKAENFQLQWKGTAEREVGAYVYNYQNYQWELLGTGSGEQEFTIDMNIDNQNVIKDGKLCILIWRGMNESLFNRESYIPSTSQYDFNFMWTSDTQFYAQNEADYPLMTQQFQWVIDNYDTLKSNMFLNTGDLVNVGNNESQWQHIDAAYKLIENANIPYAVITGNHDLQGSDNEDNVNYKNYFSPSRLEKNNPYWGGTYGDNYYYLVEENGVKMILLGMGMRWDKDDIEWATNVLKSYPDHFGVLMVHDYLKVDGEVELDSQYSNVRMLHDELVAKNDNIRLIICGHNHGVNTNLEYFGERPVYSILADYQSLPKGGLGYMRMLKFDVENNLVYVNTYSPYEDKTSYFTDKQTDKTGLYQKNKDEFVIQMDLGGYTSRTLTTTSLSMTADGTAQIGEMQTVTGPGTVSVQWQGLESGKAYTWYTVLTDKAGNTTTSEEKTFTVASTVVNRNDLDKILNEASSYTDLSQYTEESANAFRSALKNAQIIDENATQAQIDKSVADLRKAIDGLTLKPSHVHHAVKVDERAATETENGNITYWYCEGCGKYFSDEALTHEIRKEDTIIWANDNQEKASTDTTEASSDSSESIGSNMEVSSPQTGSHDPVWIISVFTAATVSCLSLITMKRLREKRKKQ